MVSFSDEMVVALQNRASDLWEEDTDVKNHDDFVAAAHRLLGALEMFWHSSLTCPAPNTDINPTITFRKFSPNTNGDVYV